MKRTVIEANKGLGEISALDFFKNKDYGLYETTSYSLGPGLYPLDAIIVAEKRVWPCKLSDHHALVMFHSHELTEKQLAQIYPQARIEEHQGEHINFW
ncbi:MAG: hypothetical protein GFH27_549283n396 [Chloroflexi bacterium AL-W]|nr:hypothetical protein [Chloroflexi bacterium AL-N1]NOK64483.1 hypothetical protein [Chloroflexi bacterium AL-N10]NOK75725.1 hypothetical protein [Chloroflexi bacterium AL-N5]NOK80517.1 hypothetical protein [Chloroflexi bacterium AL-W]NOK87031.1 hypothetical protein [Chloroflexi bacterium AL-N15]